MINNSLYLIFNASLAYPATQKNLDLCLETVHLETIVKASFSQYEETSPAFYLLLNQPYTIINLHKNNYMFALNIAW